MHIGLDAQHRFQRALQRLLLLRERAYRVSEHLRGHLHVHIQRIAVVHPVDDDLIIRSQSLIEQHGLDL